MAYPRCNDILVSVSYLLDGMRVVYHICSRKARARLPLADIMPCSHYIISNCVMRTGLVGIFGLRGILGIVGIVGI